MSTTSSARQPVARLRGPSELAAVVPMLCGFVPTESLVVVSLHGRRSRIGLTMRVDLPPPAVEAALVEQTLERVVLDGGRGMLIVVYTDGAVAGGVLPRRTLVDALTEGCARAGLTVNDALLVRDGQWWSYVCDDPTCCSSDGTPLAGPDTQAVGLVAAEHVAEGRAVLPSRSELVASLAPPTGSRAQAAARRMEATEQVRALRVAAEGRVRVGQESLRLWRRTLERTAVGPDGGTGPAVGPDGGTGPAVGPDDGAGTFPVGPETAAMLVLSLHDVLVRDEIVTWALDDEQALLSLLLSLARTCGPPYDAPVCTLVGWVAHTRGDGALANVALDRALAGDPDYSMALLCRQALDGQVPPSKVRSLLEESRRFLRELHPWTACHERP